MDNSTLPLGEYTSVDDVALIIASRLRLPPNTIWYYPNKMEYYVFSEINVIDRKGTMKRVAYVYYTEENKELRFV